MKLKSKGVVMLDNTDLNLAIVDTIIIDKIDQAEFIFKKINEDVIVTNKMREAMNLYEQKLKREESNE